jgi:replicative DNA helicase
MPDAAEHGRIVLSGVLTARGTMNTKVLDYASQRVKPEQLVDQVQRNLFLLCQRYADQHGGVPTRAVIEDLVRSREPGRALMYGEAFDALCARLAPSVAEFRHSVEQLRELAADRDTHDVLTTGMHILRGEVTQGEGNRKTVLSGHRDARAYVLSSLAGIDSDAAGTEAPEGDIRTEGREVLELYAMAQAAKLQGRAQGVLTGIPALDKLLKGSFLHPGQLGLVAGYTSAGKTAFCCQVAWDVSVIQGKNVVYLTTETLRRQVRSKIVARHSRLTQFGLPKGLNTRDISEGTLDDRGRGVFQAVLDDFGSNESYGHCYVAQVPRGSTIPQVEARLNAIGREFPIDLAIFDYLQLWKPTRPRKDRREELAEILIESKQVAVTFQDGRGLPILSPWQVSRAGREAAKANGGIYQLEGMSETAESANTADIVLAIFDPDNDASMGRSVNLDFGVPKNRDGERGGTLRVTADFANACFEARDRTNGEGMFEMAGAA